MEARPGGTRRADSDLLPFAAVSVGAAGLVKIERQDFLLISFSRSDCLRPRQRDQPESPPSSFLGGQPIQKLVKFPCRRIIGLCLVVIQPAVSL